MNIIYLGAFRLPNYDAAAPRVLNNARALRMLGNKVTFISWGGKYRQEDLCNDGKYRVDGFEYISSGDLPIGGSLKERLTTKAKAHGLSLSAFFRLAADEYMNTHNW